MSNITHLKYRNNNERNFHKIMCTQGLQYNLQIGKHEPENSSNGPKISASTVCPGKSFKLWVSISSKVGPQYQPCTPPRTMRPKSQSFHYYFAHKNGDPDS